MDTEEALKSLNEPQVLPSKLKRFSVRFFELIVTLTESSSYTAVLKRVPFFSASSILASYASIMMYFSDLSTNPGLGSSLITGLPVFNIIMETRNNRMSAIKQLIIIQVSHVASTYHSVDFPPYANFQSRHVHYPRYPIPKSLSPGKGLTYRPIGLQIRLFRPCET